MPRRNLKQTAVVVANKLNIPVEYSHALYKYYYYAESLVKHGDPYFFRIACIEINSGCNRRCYYCPVSLEKKYPNHLMEEQLFEKAIMRLKEVRFTGTVMYHFFNEPMMDKRLPQFVAFTKAHLPKTIVRILTNGDYLTLDMATQLITAGVDNFAVTDHNLTPGLLRKKLQPAIDKYPNHINVTSIHDLPLSNRGGSITVKIPDKRHGGACTIISEELKIDYEGNVLLCSNDFYRTKKFGNIADDRLDTIWKTATYAQLRRDLRQAKTSLDICKECSFTNG